MCDYNKAGAQSPAFTMIIENRETWFLSPRCEIDNQIHKKYIKK